MRLWLFHYASYMLGVLTVMGLAARPWWVRLAAFVFFSYGPSFALSRYWRPITGWVAGGLVCPRWWHRCRVSSVPATVRMDAVMEIAARARADAERIHAAMVKDAAGRMN